MCASLWKFYRCNVHANRVSSCHSAKLVVWMYLFSVFSSLPHHDTLILVVSSMQNHATLFLVSFNLGSMSMFSSNIFILRRWIVCRHFLITHRHSHTHIFRLTFARIDRFCVLLVVPLISFYRYFCAEQYIQLLVYLTFCHKSITSLRLADRCHYSFAKYQLYSGIIRKLACSNCSYNVATVCNCGYSLFLCI